MARKRRSVSKRKATKGKGRLKKGFKYARGGRIVKVKGSKKKKSRRGGKRRRGGLLKLKLPKLFG